MNKSKENDTTLASTQQVMSKTVNAPPTENPSLQIGSTSEPLWNLTLSQFLLKQSQAGPSRPCLVFCEDNVRLTYASLYSRSLKVAKALIAIGISRRDHIGIMAGNCLPYVELLFAASHIGAVLVVLNNGYSANELKAALRHSNCKIIFTSPEIGKQSNAEVLKMLDADSNSSELPDLKNVVLLTAGREQRFLPYVDFLHMGQSIAERDFMAHTSHQDPSEVCNLQFTSGTTGSPKAAMLTHNGILNNGRFIGDRMRLTSSDIICCPPPLFHCFGLVLGLLSVLTHGACIVFPSQTFNPEAVVAALVDENCTGLHGVPAMFSAELSLLKHNFSSPRLRTGIAAGAPVPRQLMETIREQMGLLEMTNTYGMTETSPASFMTFTDDPIEKRLSTVGKILPHTKAKIVDPNGDIVPVGVRGELLIAGFQLQKGYWKDPMKTKEVMTYDQEGVLWMHTGDEAIFDKDGYCSITGRLKDIIIRGGENIYPLEIEERLVQHPAISQASVVGLPSEKYGEIVAAFLQYDDQYEQPSLTALRSFVHERLGWHKAPVHVWWLKNGEEFPKTASGKIKKGELRDIGIQSLKRKASTKFKLKL